MKNKMESNKILNNYDKWDGELKQQLNREKTMKNENLNNKMVKNDEKWNGELKQRLNFEKLWKMSRGTRNDWNVEKQGKRRWGT